MTDASPPLSAPEHVHEYNGTVMDKTVAAVEKFRQCSAEHLKCLYQYSVSITALTQSFQECCEVLQNTQATLGHSIGTSSRRQTLSLPSQQQHLQQNRQGAAISLTATARNLNVAATTVTQGPEEALLRERMARHIQFATDTNTTAKSIKAMEERRRQLCKEARKLELKLLESEVKNQKKTSKSKSELKKETERNQRKDAIAMELREADRALLSTHSELLRKVAVNMEEFMYGYAQCTAILSELTARRFHMVVSPREAQCATEPSSERTVSRSTQTTEGGLYRDSSEETSRVRSVASSLFAKLKGSGLSQSGSASAGSTRHATPSAATSSIAVAAARQRLPVTYEESRDNMNDHDGVGGVGGGLYSPSGVSGGVASGVPIMEMSSDAASAYPAAAPAVRTSTAGSPQHVVAYGNGCYYVREAPSGEECSDGASPLLKSASQCTKH